MLSQQLISAGTLFASTFVLVLALGLQSLNVNGGHRTAAVLTSFFISACNLVVITKIPAGLTLIEITGYMAGGPTGILTSMALHPRLMRWMRKNPT